MAFKGDTHEGGSGSIWSPEENRTVREMWARGCAAREIGELLGRTRNAVLNYIHRHSINAGARIVPTVVRSPPVKREPQPKAAPKLLMWQPPKPTRREYEGPRPWLQRQSFECAYPVDGEGADTRSCCKPIKLLSGYCAEHRARMYSAYKPRIRVPRGV